MADKPDRNDPVRKTPSAQQAARPARPAAPAAGAPRKAAKPAAAAKGTTQTQTVGDEETIAMPAGAPVAKADSAKPVGAAKPAAAAKPIAAAKSGASMGVSHDEEEEGSFVREVVRDMPSVLVSLIVHMALLLALALVMLPNSDDGSAAKLVVIPPSETEQEIEEIQPEQIQPLEVNVDPNATVTDVVTNDTTYVSETIQGVTEDSEVAQMSVEAPAVLDVGVKSDLLTQIGGATGTGMSGRGKASRGKLVASNGGSKESELAVALALKWLAQHQLPDGGWSYDHRMAPGCQGKCDLPGQAHVQARNAATAMGLLPFLGAGQTHQEGDYKKVIAGGLTYLGNSLKPGKQGGSWHEAQGTMYSHGLASIVMCEAYGMTHDERLRIPAQQAVYYIMNNQDKNIGGWGYGGPGQDTSVSGWQIMALKSAHMAYLEVWPNSIRGIDNFLNFVQADSGASYGYTSPGRGPATTAVGLLCRMYMGWKRDHHALQRGMENMANGPIGPTGNLYRDYYAAQFMFQMTNAKGDVWKKWNDGMRDGLIGRQSRDGHMEGSWKEGGGEGRLMNTCLSTLILEVYYRHMPIQREEAVENEFPVE